MQQHRGLLENSFIHVKDLLNTCYVQSTELGAEVQQRIRWKRPPHRDHTAVGDTDGQQGVGNRPQDEGSWKEREGRERGEAKGCQ